MNVFTVEQRNEIQRIIDEAVGVAKPFQETDAAGSRAYVGGRKFYELVRQWIKFGADVNEPADTAWIVFGEDITYNYEDFKQGDMLLGDNSSGKANAKWDIATGQLQFRGGQTIQAYVDTDGSITAGAGDIWLDQDGLSIEVGAGSLQNQIKFVSGAVLMDYIADINYAATHYFQIHQESIAGKLSEMFVKTNAPTGKRSIVYINAKVNNETGAAIHIEATSAGAGYVEINEAQKDTDFMIKGLVDAQLFKTDAGLDAVAFGGAAESGTKVKVYGAAKITGAATLESTLDVTGVATFNGGISGGEWTPANETWTYASAITFTVPGDQTAKYQKGTRVKFTQTTVKYGTVISATYAAPNTTVTLAANDDYSIANAAITSPFYSYIGNPIGWPDWFNYTPTYSASGSMTFTAVTTIYAKFKVSSQTCIVAISAKGTTGGTASTGINASNPITATSIPVPGLPFACGIRDAATGLIIVGTGIIGETNISFRRPDSANWSLGIDRYIVGVAIYQI